jgi:hypothetical protein
MRPTSARHFFPGCSVSCSVPPSPKITFEESDTPMMRSSIPFDLQQSGFPFLSHSLSSDFLFLSCFPQGALSTDRTCPPSHHRGSATPDYHCSFPVLSLCSIDKIRSTKHHPVLVQRDTQPSEHKYVLCSTYVTTTRKDSTSRSIPKAGIRD